MQCHRRMTQTPATRWRAHPSHGISYGDLRICQLPFLWVCSFLLESLRSGPGASAFDLWRVFWPGSVQSPGQLLPWSNQPAGTQAGNLRTSTACRPDPGGCIYVSSARSKKFSGEITIIPFGGLMMPHLRISTRLRMQAKCTGSASTLWPTSVPRMGTNTQGLFSLDLHKGHSACTPGQLVKIFGCSIKFKEGTQLVAWVPRHKPQDGHIRQPLQGLF